MPIAQALRGPVGTALRYACSLALLAWIASGIDWAQFSALRRLDPYAVMFAAVLAGVAYPVQAWRWQLLLRTLGIAPTVPWLHGVFWIGQFYSAFLPGGVASDAVRLACLWRIAPGRRAAAAASLLADRVLGFGALLALAALALALHLAVAETTGGLAPLLLASAGGCLLLLAACASLLFTRWWEPLSRRLLGTERAGLLHDAALALGAHRRLMAAATIVSLVVWLVDFAALWLLARAVGLPVSPLDITVAATAAYLAATLPISIGGHGVREASLVGALALLGATAPGDDKAAALALAFGCVTVGWSLFGGLVQLLSLATGWPVTWRRSDQVS